MNDINLTINGKQVSVPAGTTILEAARQLDISIPTLCCREDLGGGVTSKPACCRICVVEVERRRNLAPACATPVTEGMVVHTDTERALKGRRTALELLLSEHRGDCEAPCTLACPAHASVEEYLRAISSGDFLGGLKIIKERIPLPMTVGRVCPRFCEKQCRRNADGKPVAINDFKRLAADLCYEEYKEDLPALSGKRAAIVGGGPAGLSAAYYLRLRGIGAVIFEARPQMGGMTRYGIPEYRLPKAILDREIAHFAEMGIEFRNGCELGKNISLAELKQGFDAAIIAIGCWKASGLHCEGENLALPGIGFLRAVAENHNTYPNPGRTLVVGGGNTAMDCVRTAIRLGAPEVTCLYRRSEAEMPAEKLEIAEAKEEGVRFSFLTAPVKLEKRGTSLILHCVKMALGEPDASGRRKPLPVPDSGFEMTADTVITATGQGSAVPPELPVDRFGNIAVDGDGCRVAEQLYAAGDCAYGAKTVVEAVASGRQAAMAVARDLLGIPAEKENPVNVSRGRWQDLSRSDLVVLRNDLSDSPRQELHYLPLNERKTTFREVCATMTKEQIAAEGKRCIECSCSDKTECKLRKFAGEAGCKVDAYAGERQELCYDLRHPKIIQDRGKCIKCAACVKICQELVNRSLLSFQNRGFSACVGTAFDQPFPLSCQDCGKCIEVCPTGALDWRKKK